MNSNEWHIPPSTLHWLREAPQRKAVVILLRHSVRDQLPPDDIGYQLPITDAGKRLANELGAIIGDRLRVLHSSPLTRCVQTAEALLSGTAIECPIVHDHLLGDPGIYVVDEKRAWSNWEKLGHEGVMRRLVSQNHPLPGMAAPEQAARSLVGHMLSVADEEPGFHIFVTHDSLLTATAARLLSTPLGINTWPYYLEGAFFWQEDKYLCSVYRNLRSKQHFEPALQPSNHD